MPTTVATAKQTTASNLPNLAPVAARSAEVVLKGQPVVTLQNVIMALPGICTEPGLFCSLEGQAWVSATEGTVFLGPSARLIADGFVNMLGIGNWHRACNLDGLFLALTGIGQVEVQVFQAKTGYPFEWLCSEVCALSPDIESLFDLSLYAVNGADGAIWLAVRNCSSDTVATLSAARYLTRGSMPEDLKLAVCVAQQVNPGPRAGLLQAVVADWCTKVAGAGVVGAFSGQTALAQLQAAKAQGFTHAVLMDSSTLVTPETLTRVLGFLALARDRTAAVGATLLDPADKWFIAENGVMADIDGKPAPQFRGTDLRDRMQIVSMECELAEADPEDLLLQAGFIGLSLEQVGYSARAGEGLDAYLSLQGVRLHQLSGLVVHRDAKVDAAAGPTVTLQHVIYPEKGLCTEAAMYYHANGPLNHNDSTGALHIDQRTIVHFDSYFNALNIGKWHAACKPDGLFLGLTGRGRVLVKVFHAIPDRSWELLCDAPHTLSTAIETLIDLSDYAKTAVTGMIYFELHAIGAGVQLQGARFAVPGQINPDVRLCLSITTFKRETEVENTARRMALYFETCDFAEQMHLNIVDNGNSARIIESDMITRIPNANLGGAGGFTRGLIEAEKAGYSHVLFMDDDAAIPMEALHRAYAFLTLSKDPKAVVAGAMISNSDKWRMWENGAVFDRGCRPLFSGTDLRNWTDVMNMEFQSAASRSSRLYGGWWFFAFPVAQVSRYPFPFFVRGDDINFSLANDFNITTLNGVVSFAEDFSDKESPMTLYLDLRNHMVQHLTLEKMEVGPLRIIRMALGFFYRNIVKFQYETVEALMMAWRDVLKGPEFFAQNADAAAQRTAIKAIYKTEAWQPVGDFNLTERRRFWAGELGWKRSLFRITANGHLLPFFNIWGNRVLIQPRDRSNFFPVWGASRITFLNATRDKAYTVRQS
ncbi:MAG: hypothetical protein WCS20_15965, partial [Alphaproteobacteria bacterium]